MVGNLHLERGIAYKVEGNYDAARLFRKIRGVPTYTTN